MKTTTHTITVIENDDPIQAKIAKLADSGDSGFYDWLDDGCCEISGDHIKAVHGGRRFIWRTADLIALEERLDAAIKRMIEARVDVVRAKEKAIRLWQLSTMLAGCDISEMTTIKMAQEACDRTAMKIAAANGFTYGDVADQVQ